MKKKIGYSLLIFLVLILSTGFYYIRKFNNAFFKEKTAYMSYTYESKPIQFKWAGGSKGSGGYYESQSAILFSVKLNNLKHNFFMQFDTGAPHSFIYENDLKSLKALGMDIKEVIKNEQRYVEELNFKLDENTIDAKMIRILEGYGNSFDKNDTISNISIGTIGSDFIANRITTIDFKNRTLELSNERPEWMKEYSGFKPFNYNGRRIMLPAIIDNKKYELFYDSGCSAFGLITTKNRFDKYTNKETEAIAYDAKSWDSSIAITSKLSNKRFKIGNAELSLKRVSHVNMYNAIQPLVTPFTRIGGWLGNQPFNESTLILDTETEEFIIIEN